MTRGFGSSMTDRVPPHNTKAERGVLGGILCHSDMVKVAIQILAADQFYVPAHQNIFRAMCDLERNQLPIEIVLLGERLSTKGELEDIGGYEFLAELMNSIGSGMHVEQYARIVRDKAKARELIHTNVEALRDVYDQTRSIDELLLQTEQRIVGIREGRYGSKPSANGKGHLSHWPAPVLASDLDNESNKIEWLWNGYIAKRHTTLFSALMKSGKTTLVGHLLKALQTGGTFCGRLVTQCKTLIVSEESKGIWQRRRDLLGLDNSLALLCRPMMVKPTPMDWVDFVLHVQDCASSHKADLVVIDTISTFAPWRNENDTAQQMEAVIPLNYLTQAGFGVSIFHHFGKTDDSEGKASRGSTALASAVDIILEMRRYKPGDLTDRRRTLSGMGRFDEIPSEVILELAADGSGYTAQGDKKTVEADELRELIRGVLPIESPGMTASEVHERLPEGSRSSRGDVSKALNAETGSFWQREGTGKKNSPYRFWVPV
jgi:hypothetical protein